MNISVTTNDNSNHLDNVLTVSEAARRFHVCRGTIQYHIDRGNVTYRQTEKVYLITLDSLRQLYAAQKNCTYSTTKLPA